MVPSLAESKHIMIHDMLLDGRLKHVDMAWAADCSDRAIRRFRTKLRCFGATRTPPNRVGRRRQITPVILDALCEHLIEKPGTYLDKMSVFFFDEFAILVTGSSIPKALKSIGWSKKKIRQIAGKRSAELRDHNLNTSPSLYSCGSHL